ncbi:glycosyltransferase family protein [Methylobacter luteus]|uniref:glycosyl transferase n=1 Tax=Methylobacter luteus TaxID=415 RepID=UPI000483BECF|nr:glycosyl transferase [Methylobacter luteus]
MRLVYLSPVSWTSYAQRPHKFVEWFHASTGGDVLWVDPYPTRFPLLSDFRRLGVQESTINRQSPAWLKVITPPALPIEPLPGSGMINGIMWRPVLNHIDTFAHQSQAMLVIGKPSVLALAVFDRLKDITSVYDAMDNFPCFYSGFSRLAMRWREQKLASRVTQVLTSSTTLKQRWSDVRPDVQRVLNGLDASVLPTRQISTLARERKILGYVGTIGSWFDWEWIISLANARPVDIVRLIGPIFSPSSYALPENIEILPPCPHQEALIAMQDFDVGLIPFKNTELTASVDPIKYYEYRALGLPVVSTEFGEMTFRNDEEGTFLSKKGQEINSLVQKALLYRSDEEKTRQFTDSNTWEARFTAARIM